MYTEVTKVHGKRVFTLYCQFNINKISYYSSPDLGDAQGYTLPSAHRRPVDHQMRMP